MPGDVQDGDTEGQNRDRRQSEEREEVGGATRKRNNDGEVEAAHDNVKEFEVKHTWVDIEEVEEEEDSDDDDDEDDDDSRDDYVGGANPPVNSRSQKKQAEEEKDYVWITAIDEKTLKNVMAPQYLLLEVRSSVPIQVPQFRMAVTHLARVWQWWGVGFKGRGQEKTPWLYVAPNQRPRLQESYADDEDYYGDELWELIITQRWQHRHTNEGVLSTITLITDPWQVAAAAAAAAVPHHHRSVCTSAKSNATAMSLDPPSVPNTTTTTTAICEVDTAIAGSSDSAVSSSVPDLPHKAHLMLGVPQLFLEDTSAQAISHSIISLLDDVLSGRIQEEYHPPGASKGSGEEVVAAKSPSLKTWLVEKLEARKEGSEGSVSVVNVCEQDEGNEHDMRGYVQRTFDSLTSRNFINKCKAERVSYVNGFATCVSAAAAAFLSRAEGGARGNCQRVVTRQRVCEHLHWPTAAYDLHDTDLDDDLPPPALSRPPGITITAPNSEDAAAFWEAARQVTRQRWEAVGGGDMGSGLQIMHGLLSEDSEDDIPRHPMVCLRLCDIHRDGEGADPPVQEVGGVVGVGPHSLSPPRHFLITHTINLHLEEDTQVLSFSLHHSTLFYSLETGRNFADELESALKNSLQQR